MPDSTQINWANVASQALDIGQSAINQLSELVKQTAPEVWDILMRQVYADAIGNMAIIIPAILCIIISLKLHNKFNEEMSKRYQAMNYYEAWEPFPQIVMTILTMGGIVCFVRSMVSLATLIKVLINPKYYAILKLMDMM